MFAPFKQDYHMVTPTRRWLLLVFTLIFGLASAAQDRRPNILFCIADDWGWPHAGAYGSKFVETPTFDRIANEGVLFTNAFTSNPKCAPCRASITTGRNSWQLEEGISHWNRWPEQFITYPDLLLEAGYHVGFTGKGWGPGEYKDSREHNPAGPNYDGHKNDTPGKSMSAHDYSRNFIENFLPHREEGQPFCFWLGAYEPHRAYEDGNGLRRGKKLDTVEVPGFYPDNDTIRGDMLDYAIEVEWYDTHVGRAIDHLREIGELDNTIIVMTSDHGMPFPRVKGQIYEMGYHLPLAVRWGDHAPAGRVVTDFINVRDFAPTFLEAAGLKPHAQFTGKSFVDVLRSPAEGRIDASRDVMLTGKERHDVGRPHNWGYPSRAIRTDDFLYVYNFHPERWPAGNPETGYRNVDASPTKTHLLEREDQFTHESFGKRPARQLFNIAEDPECLVNLADSAEHTAIMGELHLRLMAMLKAEGDPRLNGRADFFDTIEYLGRQTYMWDVFMENEDRKN
ncbi:MAG: sulfatase [Synoicihabitans sp.]